MEKLFLTVACGDYDRTKPLQDGSVEPEGIKLNYLPMQSEEIFWRMGHYREFDVSEMSLSNHITMLGRGRLPLRGYSDISRRDSLGILRSTTTSSRE